MIQHAVWYPMPVVTDGYDHSIAILLDLYLGGAGPRMQVNICQTGLHDAEDRKFGLFRQPAQFLSYLHFYMQTVALVNPAHVPQDCGFQTTFIEHRRVKQVGKGSELLRNTTGERSRLQENLVECRRGRGDRISYHRQVQLQDSKFLPRAVVQFTCDATALLILRPIEPPGKLA